MRTCTKCREVKPLEEFAPSKFGAGGLSSWCRTCFKAYNREYSRVRRLDPRERARDKAYADARRKNDGDRVRTIGRNHVASRQSWLNTLKQKPCVDCGRLLPPCCMDFDHVRGGKFKTITQLLGYSREVVLSEIEKCDMVCACCHRVRTGERSLRHSWKNLSAYQKAQEFRKRLDVLKSQPCMDCGQSYPPVAMDFDHVRGVKVSDVGLMSQRAWSTVLVEIEKCDLVCANCHRIRTHVVPSTSGVAA